jgi:hypothetical protein
MAAPCACAPLAARVAFLAIIIFAAVGGLPRHVAWIVMKRSWLFFSRLPLVRIFVVGQIILL